MNTELWPGGPDAYEIHTAGEHLSLGRVLVDGAQFTIEVKDGAGLEGINAGPYFSIEDAMRAIGSRTNCHSLRRWERVIGSNALHGKAGLRIRKRCRRYLRGA